ncbi:MAG: hypothetical protein KDI68_09645 [Gammaproteobacteria bacterium]|nr:hypothetical protein [Gammaproteobacteria bacterium]
MRNAKKRRGVMLLVAAAILMLPLHLSFFAFGQEVGISVVIDNHASTEPCDHGTSMGGMQHCDTHTDGTADGCCGDNCFGSQFLLPTSYLSTPVKGVRFLRLQIDNPPEPLFGSAYRPPIPRFQA